MEKAVYYGRVSTEEEKQTNALELQISDLVTFINNNENMILVGGYVDKGKSGTTRKGRYEYNKLYEDLLTDKFETVVIKDSSRLMRNVLDWYLFLDRLTKNNKKLYMYMDNQYYTPDNGFIAGIKAMMAEEYSKDLSKKISQSVKRSHENGVVYGNGQLWGYDRKDGELIINEEEAKVVRLIFELYCENKGVRRIIKRLDELGITNKNGTQFSPSTIKRMLRQPKYKGTLASGMTKKDFLTKRTMFTESDEWIIHENHVPAIVTEEVWEKANAIYDKKSRPLNEEDKKRTYGYFSGNYVFSGKIHCMKCGKTYWHSAYQGTKNYRDVWQCKTYRTHGKKNGCSNTTLHTEVLCGMVKDIIFEMCQNKDETYKMLEDTLRDVISESNPHHNTEANMLTQQLKKITIRRDNLLNAFLDGDIDKTTYNRKKLDFETDMEKINIELKRITDVVGEVESKINRIEKMKKQLDFVIQDKGNVTDEIIEVMLDKVEVDGDNIKVVLNVGNEKSVSTFNYPSVSKTIYYRTHTDNYTKHANLLIDIYLAI